MEVLTVWSDPIADMLTRIRNANLVFKDQVDIPASNLKRAIADILVREGFIKGYTYIEDGKQGVLRLQMKYKGTRKNKERVIHGIVRVSKPGRRIYVGKNNIPRVKNGLGIAIISTSKGVLTDKEAVEYGVGGEVIAYIW
ncbi:MAG: 30S ribosomal protein S8 [Fervidobacterium sp.]|nr:30S ribosomal protein S8 [Fervidobacterium sp.]